MIEDRLEFYDPLYETITFQRGLPSRRGFLALKEDPLDPIEIVRTADFARLTFLRQAGLAWLVFPSATHTRFAHSIGCWWLGRISESLIRVQGKVKPLERTSLRSLHSWLEETELREEFYLGLLFHDVGHGPFSHVLERNRHFVAGLKDAGLGHVDHENRGAALLQGEGPLADKWREIAPHRYGSEAKILADIREKLEDKNGVCLPAVLFLITKNRHFLEKCKHSHKEFLGILDELVSGLLDLDRLDHYARDSYFSGLRQISINVRGFLNNLCLKYEYSRGSKDKNVRLSLSGDGASHAASLLFGKRQIISTMFRTPRTIALHTMINWALSAYLEDLGNRKGIRANKCLEIALMEDDQFLEMIAGASHEGCRYISRRIRAMHPYECVAKWSNEKVAVDQNELQRKLDRYGSSLGSNGSPNVLLHYEDGFWPASRFETSRDWLDTGRLILADTGTFLTEHPDHRDNFIHLRDADRVKYLWVFAREKASKDKVKGEIGEILNSAIT